MPFGGGGSSGNTTTVQKSDPWSGQQPYLTQQFQQAQNLYNSGQLAPQYFPGQTVASQSPFTQQAIQGTAAAATSPQTTGLDNAANQQITDTLNGAYLDPTKNPGFAQALADTQKAYSTGTAAQTDAAFNRSGAYGGSAYDETKGMQNKSYADSLNTLAGNMYTQGRSNQLQAAAIAPQTEGMPFAATSALAGAGGTQDAYNQSLINANVNKYNYNANLPQGGLQNYISLTGGNYGGTNTTTQPYYSNTGANAIGGGIGGALGGAALFNAFPATLGGLGLSAGSSGALGGLLGLGLGLSDMRVKENIHYTGHENGIPTYNFSYRGDPLQTVYHGVMAQDILTTHPHAVQIIDGGFYAVDYSKLGVEFRRVSPPVTKH